MQKLFRSIKKKIRIYWKRSAELLMHKIQTRSIQVMLSVWREGDKNQLPSIEVI